MNRNRTNVYREFHVTRHVARHTTFVLNYFAVKDMITYLDEKQDKLDSCLLKSKMVDLRDKLGDVNISNEDWTLKYPKVYLKDLKDELEIARKDAKDLIYLMRETSGQRYELIDGEKLHFSLAKKFKFYNFECEDFDYIKIIEYKMQNQDYKVDLEKAYTQLAILGIAILNLRYAILLYEQYLNEK